MQKKNKSKKTVKHTPIWKRAIWWAVSAFVVIAIATATIIMLTQSGDKTRLNANISSPNVATFTDDNTMFFATQNSVPEPNNDRNLTTPDDIIISYNLDSGPYAPAFKMGITNEDLPNKIKITPFIRGEWYILNDSAIGFAPKTSWPAGETFTVKLDSDLFNDDVKIDTNRVKFETPNIAATVDNFNLYTAPTDKKSVVAVAVISFNYQIDTKNFMDKISLRTDGDDTDFIVKFDRFHRTAFIISAPIKITDTPQNVRLKINRIPAASGDSKTEKLTANVTIESADNIFKIQSIQTNIVNLDDGNSQQLILLDTTTAAQSNIDWSKYLTVYLLPEYRDDDERNNEQIHNWKNDEITDEVISQSQKLDIKSVDFATPNGVHQYAFSYAVSDDNNRDIYIELKPGAVSENGFTMKNGMNTVLCVPYLPKSVEIAGSGALLSLSGDQKLGLVARGGADMAYVNLYKVKSSEINHLISQTYNVFADAMAFKSWAFGAYDMSVVFQKQIPFASTSRTRANYASIDLGDYLTRTYGDNTGIFIIQTGTSENAAEYNDKRLILLTDLGIIRKTNLDGSSVVFVSNLGDGTPASDTEISVLGRNGNAVWAGRTDGDGRANIPSLPWSEYRNSREPVAIVARRGNDVSFIPYNAYDQRVEYSKFDVDGTYAVATNPLNAYVFSDRGIYRPGEEIIIGGIIKNKSFKSLSGIPVRLQIFDPRGRLAFEKTFSLTSDGMFDETYNIQNGAPLGTWTAYVYSLTSNNNLNDMLGMMNFEVQEFTPDTMKINVQIAGASNNGGWISPDNLSASVSLRNMFGTPATGRRISAYATLTPTEYSFDKFQGYKFTPNFISGTGLSENTARHNQTYSVEIQDVTTDDKGVAKFDINFNQTIPSGTYTLTLNVRGFESNSGRNVQTNITARASNAKYLLGWRANGDLGYINRNASRMVNIVAVDHTATPTTANGLTMRVIQRENQTTLVKDYSNTYKYQTTTRNKIISQRQIDIPSNGLDITLDTSNGGNYIMQILDASDKILTSVEYFVAGAKNDTLQSDTNADLEIKLNGEQFASGDKIEISITAPYVGTGLITIERDRVYAYKWFRTTTTSSIQSITVPNDFSGTGYVNVSFVRDINSRDIFTTPYAYAVAPFSADVSTHEIGIKLSTPDIVRDNKLQIEYTTDKDARLMIFAINTGILQVAKYQIPNPIAHFFQKSALQVETFQILSLLLPEYNALREYAKTGGGDYGTGEDGAAIEQNPFARSTLPPVAFYSGIIDAHANQTGFVDFEIPSYFNGELKIFAVATNTTAVGASDTETTVQSPIIISMNAPVAVAPGDKFDINSVITNMTTLDTTNATITATSTRGIALNGDTTATSEIPYGDEKLFIFNTIATNALGNADITITAEIPDATTRTSTTTLSVRPATTYKNYITAGEINSHTKTISNFQIDMYPEYATRKLYISRGPDAMILPLFEYLKNYDLPCTEQLTSRAMPYAVNPTSDILGTTFDASDKIITDTINALKNRQNADGSFALWSGNAASYGNQSAPNTATLTAYVAEFLTIARDNGFNVPKEMLSRAIDYLRTFAGGTITDVKYANAAARAIYVISTNDYVTTSYIDAFTQYANENIKNWEQTVMGAYIAAAYKIMRQDDLARDLFAKYELSSDDDFEYSDMFNNNVANDAAYYYIARKYFTPQNPMDSRTLRAYIASGGYSAYTSAMVIMAASGTTDATTPDVKITTNVGTNSGDIPANATEIKIECADCSPDAPVFYTLMQSGFPTHTTRESNGIEIIREYFDMDGNRITSANIGDMITVKISARTRGNTDTAENVAITDLLPGGFIATTDSIKGDISYAMVREDRVLIFTDLTRTPREFTYTAQIGTAGIFAIPAVTAQSMYNPSINATGAAGTFTVTNENVE